MALVLQLLPLLLSRAQGNPGASLDGRPGDRVTLSCVGVSQPTRWAWAPRFPACKGLSKGRRPILLASPSGTPTVSPAQPFAGRLRALDLDIRRLELLLSAGDSGTFICKGRQENESRTELQVMGDRAYCGAPGPTYGPVYPQILIPLLGAGLVLGLGVLGWACWLRRRLPPHPPRPPPRFVPLVKVEPQRPAEEEDPKIAGDLDQEPSLLYADLDHMALRSSCRLSPVVPTDTSTTYAVVVRKEAVTPNLTSRGLPALHNTPPLLGPSPGEGRHHGIEMSARLGVRRPSIQGISAVDLGPSLPPSLTQLSGILHH